MFDVGDLPTLTFGNWVLKGEWLSGLRNNTYVLYVFYCFSILKKHDFSGFLSCCARFLEHCWLTQDTHCWVRPARCQHGWSGVSKETCTESGFVDRTIVENGNVFVQPWTTKILGSAQHWSSVRLENIAVLHCVRSQRQLWAEMRWRSVGGLAVSQLRKLQSATQWRISRS